MKALHKKMLRELLGMWSQALAIALVVAGGVATYVMSATTLNSLQASQAALYSEYHFADVFVSLKRAPETVAERMREVSGVQTVVTRVRAAANLEIEGFDEPVSAEILSLPDSGQPELSRIHLRQGRLPDPLRDNETVIGDSFADAQDLGPGDTLTAIINGRRKKLTVVGVGLSPEHIFQMPPGALFPDYKRYGALWMSRTPLAAAYDMEGAFNDAALALAPNASLEEVLDRLDDVLETYGGLGAYGRKDQLSHRYLSEEFKSLKQIATVFPVIFLSVSAFLLGVVISRIIGAQRELIAILKAFGYSNAAVACHYLQMVLMVSTLGAVMGIGAGAWMAKGMTGLYMEFYRFPEMIFVIHPRVILISLVAGAAAAAFGGLRAVLRAASLPPAEAMRPEPPATYKKTLVERMGLGRLLDQPGRMIARNLGRKPLKTLLSVVGIAMACAIMMTGASFNDAATHLIFVQFNLLQREDMAVTFTDPTSREALFELAALPGVTRVEGVRSAPARLRFGHKSHRTSVTGMPRDQDLRRLLDTSLAPVPLPPTGVVITKFLGEMLGVKPGDILTVEVLEGSRPVKRVPVLGLVQEYLGVAAYMDLDALNALMGQGNAVSGAYLAADQERLREIYDRLNDRPRVAGTVLQKQAVEAYMDSMDRQVLVFAFFNTLLAAAIAFGVVYNSARIALAERGRELASLRVLGYTRGEISYILLGELGVQTLLAIPVGFVIGRGLCMLIYRGFENELFRIPLVIETSTYALAAAVVLASALVSAAVIRVKLNRLDLIEVLKTRE